MNSFYSLDEIKKIGLKSFGKNVMISKKASLYNVDQIEIGSNVRIDDFCVLSGKIKIGSYVHISAFCGLYGKFGIDIGDYSGTSPRTLVFSAIDDFSGEYLINPMIPKEFTNVTGGKVIIEKYCQIGANSMIMPNITIKEGAVTGAFTLVNKSLEGWTVYVGIPSRELKKRGKSLLQYVPKFILLFIFNILFFV